jgi:hypothetical protein
MCNRDSGPVSWDSRLRDIVSARNFATNIGTREQRLIHHVALAVVRLWIPVDGFDGIDSEFKAAVAGLHLRVQRARPRPVAWAPTSVTGGKDAFGEISRDEIGVHAR